MYSHLFDAERNLNIDYIIEFGFLAHSEDEISLLTKQKVLLVTKNCFFFNILIRSKIMQTSIGLN